MEKLFATRKTRAAREPEEAREYPSNTLFNPEALADLPPYWARVQMGRHLRRAIRAEVARIFFEYRDERERDRALRRECPFAPKTPLRQVWSRARQAEADRWKRARKAGRHLQPALPGMDRFDYEDDQ